MKQLINFLELYKEVKKGNKELYQNLKALGVGFDTVVMTSQTKETFASFLIQSEDKSMFNDLWHHTANQHGQSYLGAVLIKLFKTDIDSGAFLDLQDYHKSESLFQKAVEGGQPWAVQAAYDSYSYCASMDGHQFGLPKELPTLQQVYEWAFNGNIKPENLTSIISIANNEKHFYLKDWLASENNEKPLIIDFITCHKDEVQNRIDYIENKYDDFNVNNIYSSHSILTSLIENNHLKLAIELHEKGYLDISRTFTENESKIVTQHANVLISKMLELTKNEASNNILNELMGGFNDVVKSQEEHVKHNNITNFSDYVKAIDSVKFIVHQDVDKTYLSREISNLNSIKDQADFCLFNEMVRKDFNPKNTNRLSLK